MNYWYLSMIIPDFPKHMVIHSHFGPRHVPRNGARCGITSPAPHFGQGIFPPWSIKMLSGIIHSLPFTDRANWNGKITTLWCHQTWLGKSTLNGDFKRKITDKWSIFHCHVWVPEGSPNDLKLLSLIAVVVNTKMLQLLKKPPYSTSILMPTRLHEQRAKEGATTTNFYASQRHGNRLRLQNLRFLRSYKMPNLSWW